MLWSQLRAVGLHASHVSDIAGLRKHVARMEQLASQSTDGHTYAERLSALLYLSLWPKEPESTLKYLKENVAHGQLKFDDAPVRELGMA
eukprot:363790-Chlamydomonas_euryale.AAC.8